MAWCTCQSEGKSWFSKLLPCIHALPGLKTRHAVDAGWVVLLFNRRVDGTTQMSWRNPLPLMSLMSHLVSLYEAQTCNLKHISATILQSFNCIYSHPNLRISVLKITHVADKCAKLETRKFLVVHAIMQLQSAQALWVLAHPGPWLAEVWEPSHWELVQASPCVLWSFPARCWLLWRQRLQQWHHPRERPFLLFATFREARFEQRNFPFKTHGTQFLLDTEPVQACCGRGLRFRPRDGPIGPALQQGCWNRRQPRSAGDGAEK